MTAYDSLIVPNLETSQFPYPILPYDSSFTQSFTSSRRRAKDSLARKGRQNKEAKKAKDLETALKELDSGSITSTELILSASSRFSEDPSYAEATVIRIRRWAELPKKRLDFVGLVQRRDPKPFSPDGLAYLANMLADHHQATGDIQSLSTLSKVIDRLTLHQTAVSTSVAGFAAKSIERELQFYAKLQGKLIDNPLGERISPTSLELPSSIETLPSLAFVMQSSQRARAYIQHLAAAGVIPEQIYLVEDQKATPDWLKGTEEHSFFDAKKSLEESAKELGINLVKIYAPKKFNDPALIEALAQSSQKYALFAGSGIIKTPTLNAGPKLIHAHPGSVPDARGATTIYFNLLEGKNPTVTGFYMVKDLDAGDVIHAQSFLPPGHDAKIGSVYDAKIRAEVMAKIALSLRDQGHIEATPQSNEAEGQYFVIHPTLRTMAQAYRIDKQDQLMFR